MLRLDLLQTYLLAVNAFAFVLGALDAQKRANARHDARGGRREGAVSIPVLLLFCVAGGCAGELTASLVWDKNTRKSNVGLRFFALGALVAWAIVLANMYGWHRFDANELARSLQRDHTPLLCYLAAINLVTFAVFCADKIRALRDRWRIPEGTLMGLSMAGGSVGGMLAMLVARHKIRSAHFLFGLPLMALLQLAVVAFMLQAGWV